MKVLLASSPIIGHVNPMMTAARILKQAGYEVSIYIGETLSGKI
jgi:UDP:flavonoid glycosyltransferase YjiC (YdhE family)